MYCPACGFSNQPTASFCGKCGNQLPVDNSSPQASANPNSAPVVAATQTTGIAISRKIMMIIIVVAIICAGIFLYKVLAGEKPIDTVNKFIQAINEKDINTAMSCMDPKSEKVYKASSKILSGVIGFELTDLAALFPGLLQISGCPVDLQMNITEVVSQDITGNDATVVVRIRALETDGDGNQSVDGGLSKFQLHKFNEGWRITSFN